MKERMEEGNLWWSRKQGGTGKKIHVEKPGGFDRRKKFCGGGTWEERGGSGVKRSEGRGGGRGEKVQKLFKK